MVGSRTLDGPLEGRERGLDGVASVVGRIPGVAVLLDKSIAGLREVERLTGLC